MRSQAPFRCTRHPGKCIVFFLMTSIAIGSIASIDPGNPKLMGMAVEALLGYIVGRMAIDTALMGEYIHHGIESKEAFLCGWCLLACLRGFIGLLISVDPSNGNDHSEQ